MHLHGHHVVVLARNGVPATGSPWWVDSLNVLPGETYDIAFYGRIIPASGWTTATTSNTPPKA